MTEKIRKQPKIYLIDWVDSCGNNGWLSEDECKAGLSNCQTVGFLVEETVDAYCLALNRTSSTFHKPFGDIISIPKVAVTRAVKLK